MRVRIISLMIVINLLMVLMIQGCALTPESKARITAKALEKKYGEEFIIHKTFNYDIDWDAYASPKDLPEVVFEAHINPDGTVAYDQYCRSYIQYSMNKEIEYELKQFFPDSYCRISQLHAIINVNPQFRQLSLEELVGALEYRDDMPIHGCLLDIYINKDVGSSKDYEGEYTFFTDRVNELIDENKMTEVKVFLYMTDSEKIESVKKYFLQNADYYSDYEELMENTPEVHFNFIKDFENGLVSKDKYIEERKKFENE